MSSADFTRFVDPAAVPRLSKADCRMSLSAYPPFVEPLLGMWAPLSREPFRGVTNDGRVVAGLFERHPDGSPVAQAAEAASAWLRTLSPGVRSQVQFPVESEFWRQWQNTPLVLRDPQVELCTLDPAQREHALEIVRASLSAEGYRRTREVMANNLFLGRLIDMTDVLNDWAFTLSIFGEPSTVSPWGWQLFGHHLALNCLFVDGQMVLSPVFMGLEPDHDHGSERRRVFEPHETQALGLFRSLGPSEQRRAVLYGSMLAADQPAGRFHPDDGRQQGGAFQDNRVVRPEGVEVAGLGQDQRRSLLRLAELFVDTMPDGPFDARMREIERHLDHTRFAWIGQANDVDPFYFRIHSPVALIEFDHHSGIFLANEDPARFHVHTIVRTPNGNDYGADLLRQHYALGGHGGEIHQPGNDGRDAHRHDHDHGSDHGTPHSHDGGLTMHSHD